MEKKRESAIVRAAKYDDIRDHYRILNKTVEEPGSLLVKIASLQEENERLILENRAIRKDLERVWEHRKDLLMNLLKN